MAKKRKQSVSDDNEDVFEELEEFAEDETVEAGSVGYKVIEKDQNIDGQLYKVGDTVMLTPERAKELMESSDSGCLLEESKNG